MLAKLVLVISLTAASSVLAADSIAVDIKLFQFKPKELEVRKSATVTWTNGDQIEHSVTAGEPGRLPGDFDSGFFTKGQSFSRTFGVAGTFSYYCKRHPSMQARVRVVE